MSELYLKDTKVLTLKDVEGVPSDVLKVDTPELLPLSLKDNCTSENFQKWISQRAIPDNREGLSDVINDFGRGLLKNKSYASLTDQYWIMWRSEQWRRINFFDNFYDKDLGDMFFTPWSVPVQKTYKNHTPDLTTGGILTKRWVQNPDKTSYLVKAGSRASHQEPLSEVLVSVFAEQLGKIPCVKYDMWVEGVTMCSRCDNFITKDTELVPASVIYNRIPKNENESVYDHLIRACDAHEIEGAKEFIDWMIFIDSATGNEDRNLGNIGFIRDSNTMKFIGPAPLYDSGNAYWSTKKINEQIKSKLFGDMESKLFKSLKKDCDFEAIAKSSAFEKLIDKYPGITDEKKGNLSKAIKERNQRLLRNISIQEIGR